MGVYSKINLDHWNSFFRLLIKSIIKLENFQFALVIKTIFDSTKSYTSVFA